MSALTASARNGSRDTAVHSVTSIQGAWLVAQREITTKLRSKAFMISTAILLLLIVGGVFAGSLLAQNGTLASLFGSNSVAVVDGAVSNETRATLDAGDFTVTEVSDRAAAESLVRDGTVDAALVPGDHTLVVIANDAVPQALMQTLSVTPPLELLDAADSNPLFAQLVMIAFGVVFMMSALTFGATIAQSVVEEKQTRMVEILLATISARTMLAGKVLGNSILAIAQVCTIVGLCAIALFATGQTGFLGGIGSSLIWFGVLFAFGFVLLAALFATLGSMVSRQEDIGSATSPITMLIMLPYIGVILFGNNPQVMLAMSYIPFSAPVAMPGRLYLGEALWWEPLVAIAILIATVLLVVILGARIYSNSILRTGLRVKFREALRSS